MVDGHARVREAGTDNRPAYFAHIVLYTKNRPAMVDWYMTVLGAEVTCDSQGLTFLTFDEEHHRIAIIERKDLADPVPNSTGLAHFAYSYTTLGDLVRLYRRLKAAGIEPYRQINHGPTTSLYYHDPDGNAVECQTDNFPDLETLNEWFASGAFDRNPIGVNIDFDELAARLDAGEPEERLLAPLQT